MGTDVTRLAAGLRRSWETVPGRFAAGLALSDPRGLLAIEEERLVGRQRSSRRTATERSSFYDKEHAMDIAAPAHLLREAEEHHGPYEKTAPKHHWWDWYAAYIDARQHDRTPDDASGAARRYVAGLLAER